MSPGFHRNVHRQSSFSVSSEKHSSSSQLDKKNDDNLTPQQYGVMGKLIHCLFFQCQIYITFLVR